VVAVLGRETANAPRSQFLFPLIIECTVISTEGISIAQCRREKSFSRIQRLKNLPKNRFHLVALDGMTGYVVWHSGMQEVGAPRTLPAFHPHIKRPCHFE